ncbi:hypothetical protein K8S19_12660 [bacterium]|nr:hypothetical protein [bacterium]
MKWYSLTMIMMLMFAQIYTISDAATTTIDYPIVVSVAMDPIDLEAVTESMHFGAVGLNETVFSNQPGGNPRCTIRNAGYADVDFSVSASISGGWELGTSINDVGLNRCVIAGIFTYPVTTMDAPGYSRDLVAEDFGDNDVLGPVAITATTDQLARDNALSDPDDYETFKGYHVLAIPNQDIRSLRFMVKTPIEDTTYTQQFFNIVIGASID